MNFEKIKMAAGGHFGKQLKKGVCSRGIFCGFFLVIIGTQRTPNPQKPLYLQFFSDGILLGFVAWIIRLKWFLSGIKNLQLNYSLQYVCKRV